MIRVLHAGGMASESKRLLLKVVEDYRGKESEFYRLGIKYLVETLLPFVKGRKMGKLSRDVEMALFAKEVEVSWSEWLTYFPGTSVEAFEDRQEGKKMVVSPIGLCKHGPEPFLKDKAGVFYTPNGFHEDVRAGKIRRRDSGNMKFINAFYVDLDNAPTKELKDVHMKRIRASTLTPSFVVETRNGFHVLWLLDVVCDEMGARRWKNIQGGLIRQFQSDKACSDISRLLRIPGSWHCKGLWEGGEAFEVKLIYKNPVRYTMDDFAMYETKLRERVVIDSPGELLAPMVVGLSVGDRHASLKEEVARTYARIGTSVELAPKARETMKDWYRNSCIDLKTNWEAEVDKCCDWTEIQQFNNKVS